MKSLKAILPLFTLSLCLFLTSPAGAENPSVELQTSKGKIVLELYADEAPVTVANFLAYVEAKFYDGTIFHRVIRGFMIQGGGFSADMQQKKTLPPVRNEADNRLKNERGSIAMARTRDPHSATAQFFINLVDNDFLNHTAKSAKGWGYAVFGKVTSGMEVVDAIAGVQTGNQGRFRDVPTEAVVIISARKISLK
jgi:cyclophilin family peptidyl-prolyl cis-trans isomerase